MPTSTGVAKDYPSTSFDTEAAGFRGMSRRQSLHMLRFNLRTNSAISVQIEFYKFSELRKGAMDGASLINSSSPIS